MPHLQDSINKSPVWGTMQHQCHYIPMPTRLDKPVTGGGLCNTTYPHLQDSMNTTYPYLQDSVDRSLCGGLCATPTRLDTQVAGVGDYSTLHTHRCGELCNTKATPTRLDTQVAGVGDYATPLPTRLDKQVAGVGDYAPLHTHTYKTS